MKMSSRYRDLNDEGRWPKFSFQRLELSADAEITPSARPASGNPSSASARPGVVADVAAGLAIGPEHEVYWTDPAGLRIQRRDACSGSIETFACFDGGSE